jgi:DNA-binding transcriptional MerR regulator
LFIVPISQTSEKFLGSLGGPGYFLDLCGVLLAFYPFSKGVLIMAILPLAACAQMLGIHPKTLHHWLKEANVPLAAHPTDARIKCVAEEHIQEVARRHGERPLPDLSSVPRFHGCVSPGSQEEQAKLLSANEVEPDHPSSSLPEADLIQKLSSLETKIATLQEQLAQFALVLFQERENSVERQLTTLEALIQELVGRPVCLPPLPDREETLKGFEQPVVSKVARPLHPAEQLARSRMPALIEYCAPGSYVIISAQEGEVHLEPDSRAWFDWLATLSSFRFVGSAGRFTAHRGYKQSLQTRYWSASRCVRRHTYKHYLGMTESLTIANLEHIAARLQSDIDAR